MAAYMTGKRMRIVVQGQDISHLVREFAVQASAHSVVTMRLELVGALEMDADGTVYIGDRTVTPGEKPVMRAISLGGLIKT